MLLILLSWLFFFCCFLGTGIAIERIFRFRNTTLPIAIILGIVGQTALLCILAFAIPLGFEVFLGNVALNAFLLYRYSTTAQAKWRDFILQIKQLPKLGKLSLLLLLVAALFKSALAPLILDNESYYIQTIKWINEYGFVPGLANFNVSFGQSSPWQVLQAGFNFHFWTNRLNDINGFLLLVCSVYFLLEFEKRFRDSKRFHWIGALLFFNALTFQFINAPSPDFPVMLLGQIALFLFLCSENQLTEQSKLAMILLIFITFVKITVAPLSATLIVLLVLKNKNFGFAAAVGSCFGLIWLAKNALLTGFPFYPFAFGGLNVDWRMPDGLLQFINRMIADHEFLAIPNYQTLSLGEKFVVWIQFSGIDGFFNKGIVLLFLITPFTLEFRTIRNYRIAYLFALVHFTVVFVSSPQFRFFLIDFLFLTAWLITAVFNRIKLQPQLYRLGYVFSAVCPIAIAFLIDFKSFTANKHMQKSEQIHVEQLVIPEPNSKYYEVGFERFTEGNLNYYSPKPNFFYYGTGDGPLPCTNVNVIELFKQQLNIIPQLRTNQLKDGFYSKEINQNSGHKQR